MHGGHLSVLHSSNMMGSNKLAQPDEIRAVFLKITLSCNDKFYAFSNVSHEASGHPEVFRSLATSGYRKSHS